jgi:hypothetical protein
MRVDAPATRPLKGFLEQVLLEAVALEVGCELRGGGEQLWLVTFMQYDLATSMTRRAGWSRSRIPSARKCYPCLRPE